MNKLIDWQNEVFEIRPPDDMYEVVRYNNGLWTPDDGGWDVAFGCYWKNRVWSVGLPYYTNISWQFLTTHWSGHVEGHPRGGNAWHRVSTDGSDFNDATFWKARDRHPNIVAGNVAMSHVASVTRCASGAPVNFNPADDFIKQGRIRLQKTREIVTVPSDASCLYCGCSIVEAITEAI